MKTTLNKIRAHRPCDNGWKKLLTNLGKTKSDDAPLALTTILESNGIDDALWCLQAVDGHKREMRLFAVECARSVRHLIADKRSINAIDMAERFANGEATRQELDAARSAAWSAARAAASDASRAAARAAAWAAASDASRAAASDAAWSAERAAAWSAASDAAWSAASDAVRGAVRGAASDAAMATARGAQANLFILMCEGAFDANAS